MRKRLCQENNAVDMDVHRGRYDYADIGQRIMYARSSDGLYKRAAGPQHSPAKRFRERNYPAPSAQW